MFSVLGALFSLAAVESSDQIQTDNQKPCLSIKDAIHRAMENHPNILIAEANQDAAQANLIAARSRSFPTVTLFGQSGFGETPPIDRRSDEQIGAQLNLELYSFGSRRFAKEAAKHQLEAAKLGVGIAHEDIAAAAALAFVEHQRAVELVALAKEQEEALRSDAKTAPSRLERQVITLGEASQIRSRYAAAKSEVINRELAQRTAQANLSLLIGYEANCYGGAGLTELDRFETKRLMRLNTDEAIDMALHHSSQIKQSLAEVNSAESSVKEASKAGLPTLNLTGFTTYEYDNFTDDFVREERLGVSLTQDLFTGGRNHANSLSAKSRLKDAKANAELDRMSIAEGINRFHTEANYLQKANRELNESRSQAKVRLKNTKLEYQLGTKTLTDLVLAQEDYYRAAQQETITRYSSYESIIRLRQAAGIMI
ncbi:MAG: TolC family protein, partial [Pseudomonadota bacterium]